MMDRNHELSLKRQAALLALSRSSVHYTPKATPAADLGVMKRIDALRLEYPFAGAGCSATSCGVRASKSVGSGSAN